MPINSLDFFKTARDMRGAERPCRRTASDGVCGRQHLRRSFLKAAEVDMVGRNFPGALRFLMRTFPDILRFQARGGPGALRVRMRNAPGAACLQPRRLSGAMRRLCLCALCLLLVQGAGCSLRGAGGGGEGTASGRAVSNVALSAVGVPYRIGGSTPEKGFDCSGLVFWAYTRNGVRVPRTAAEQSGAGASVRRSELKPGDILVFKIKSGLHTAVYVGENRFVHSPSSGKKVRVDSISGDYWKTRLIAARRVRQIY
ncbi:MAG: C40 family peptidase [Desulfovibrio sp.]|nr:C40 family peptidase [Desulfovibrio sp.]